MGEATVLQALMITTAAGLSTGIGSVLGLFSKEPSARFISFSLGFSAGVMIFVAFIELLPKALQAQGLGHLGAYSAFFAGMLIYYLIDLMIPHDYIGQHDHPPDGSSPPEGLNRQTMQRTGLLVMLGITIHNFPEGMATFVSALQDLKLGLALGIAIALHNIPEGLAISAPVYFASGSRKKAFSWSMLSGMSEIMGGVIAAAVLVPVLTEAVMGIALAAVGGIMVSISLDELIPVAKTMESEHFPIMGVITGMMIMAASLYILK